LKKILIQSFFTLSFILASCASPSADLVGDLDHDGDVDFSDFLAFASNFGKTESVRVLRPGEKIAGYYTLQKFSNDALGLTLEPPNAISGELWIHPTGSTSWHIYTKLVKRIETFSGFQTVSEDSIIAFPSDGFADDKAYVWSYSIDETKKYESILKATNHYTGVSVTWRRVNVYQWKFQNLF
jgi:hypothetical protein